MREGWREASLKDVAGVNPKTSGVDAASPFITMSDVSEWGRWATTTSTKGSRGGIRALGGDVLVARITPCLENGKIAQIPHNWEASGGSTEFIVLRGSSEVLSDYLLLWAQSRRVHEQAVGLMIGSTGRQRVSAADYGKLQIAIPPLADQRRIVDLIGSVDDAIEAAEESAANLQDVLRWYPDGVLGRAESDFWEAEPLRIILGGDDAIRTGPFGSQLHKHDYVPDGPVGVIMPANMSNGRVDLQSVARIGHEDAERLSRHLTQPGDIVWARRGDVTRFAIIDEEAAGSLCGTGCFLLRPNDPLDTPWLEVILSSQRIAEWLIDHAVGATMPNLNRSILGSIPVRVPPPYIRAPLAEAWGSLRSAESMLRHSTDSLRDLRSNLLTVLLSGEHEIPESYDELLEDAAL